MRTSRLALLSGCTLGASAVALGAFGAHALRDVLDEPSREIWHTAVDYQFWHALALLVTGILARDSIARAGTCAAIAFGIGAVLFCGSLYALALGAPRMIGATTPFGGAALIIGWIALGALSWSRTSLR